MNNTKNVQVWGGGWEGTYLCARDRRDDSAAKPTLCRVHGGRPTIDDDDGDDDDDGVATSRVVRFW